VRLSLDIPTEPGAYPFSHIIRVRFAETDAMGVAHHSSYVPWFEETRVEYLRALGHPYREIRAEGLDLAVLELVAQYRQSARFEDEVTVHTRVSSVKGATFQMDYLLMLDDAICAVAATVHGVVDANGRATRAPAWLRALLSVT
jgi:acyl-CoA thioester hydrolase